MPPSLARYRRARNQSSLAVLVIFFSASNLGGKFYWTRRTKILFDRQSEKESNRSILWNLRVQLSFSPCVTLPFDEVADNFDCAISRAVLRITVGGIPPLVSEPKHYMFPLQIPTN